ncbi:MAG: B12-binding domain-containing radical SAM protein [Deltaproteobacteria bacterium]|nr:B12-binding domain-containing radical SAM protein [Deltaproteobacteria bacterium]
MSDIVLVFPYFDTHSPQTMLFHPLGIAQLTALLRQENMDVTVIDCTFRQRVDVLAEIVTARPRIVGIYTMVSISENALAIAGELRLRLPETLLLCGGPLSTLRPEQFSRFFHLILRGEAIHALPGLCRDFLRPGTSVHDLGVLLGDPEKYPGVYYREPGNHSIIQSLQRSSDEEMLNRLPIPDRHGYDHGCYQRFWIDREGFSLAGIMTTYGCPYQCDFCSKPIFGDQFRRRSMVRIFEEIRDIRTWGYDGLWIADDGFTLDLNHLRAFCERLIREKLDMKWFCLSRVDAITRQDIELMQQSGCRKVYLGLESGSNEVLHLMNKQATVEMAEKTVAMFAQSGIQSAGFFMIGYPGETYASIETTFQWALNLPLDEISFTIPYPLPGTRFFDKAFPVRNEADWQHENENRFVYRSDFDEDYLKQRISEVYARFRAGRKSGSMQTHGVR